MTIAEENAKALRQAMDVLVFVDETAETPSAVSATNVLSGYDSNARVTTNGTLVKLMDFSNGGFALDGKAKPISSTALSAGQKYGYISKCLASSTGFLGWNQLIPNGNFESTSGWTAEYGTIATDTLAPAIANVETAPASVSAVAGIAVVGNEYSVNKLVFSATSAEGTNCRISRNFNGISGHKILALAKFKSKRANVTSGGITIYNGSATTGSTFTTNTFEYVQMYHFETLSATGTHTFRVWGKCESVSGAWEVRDCMVFDLTEIFGSGYEPTTLDAFKQSSEWKRYAYVDYCEYTEIAQPTVTITSANAWSEVTLTLCDSKGNHTVTTYPVTWSSSQTQITLKQFTPNERCRIEKVCLGKAWIFDNSNLINFNAVLRGADSDLEDGSFSLQASDVSFSAYIGGVGDTYIKTFSEMEKNAPIAFSCGYKDDMSAVRNFYMDEVNFDVENRTLTVSGYDATPTALDGETGGKYIASTYGAVRQAYYDYIKSILTNAGITPTESGTVPSGSTTASSNLFFDAKSKREIIAEAVTLNQDATRFALTYRDAGIPELKAGTITTEWQINEEDVESFKTEVERNVKAYQADIYFYSASTVFEEICTQTGCVQNSIYFIDSSDPLYAVSTSASSQTSDVTLVTPYKIKLVAASSSDITIYGKKIIKSTDTANNPYTDTDSNQKGITVDLGEFQCAPSDGCSTGSLTKNGIHDLLEAYNIKYSFTWRGNPHIKPYDIVRMKRLSEGQLMPAENLYPSETLYPILESEVTMRITSVSLEFEEGGGLKSQIEARKLS